MGFICPECNIHQAQVSVMKPDGSRPTSSKDFVIRKLACGHTMASDELDVYLKNIREIEKEKVAAINKIEKETEARIGKVYSQMVAKSTGGRN